MLFNIPQFIDKEDKIVGPFTAKQLGWMFGAGATLLVLWNMLDLAAFILAAIIVGIIFGAMAFWRPYNQSCLAFLFSIFSFSSRPKIYIWKRVPKKELIPKKETAQKEIANPNKKNISQKKIAEISKLLDEE
jgi:hypothetical protein